MGGGRAGGSGGGATGEHPARRNLNPARRFSTDEHKLLAHMTRLSVAILSVLVADAAGLQLKVSRHRTRCPLAFCLPLGCAQGPSST